MPVPDYESLMLPLLQLSVDGQTGTISAACTNLCRQYGTAENDPVLVGRLGTAKLYLTQAKLLEVPTKATFQITKRGKDLLKSPPVKITRVFLQRYPEFSAVQKMAAKKTTTASPAVAAVVPAPPAKVVAPVLAKPTPLPAAPPVTPTAIPIMEVPEKMLEQAWQQLRKSLADNLLNQIMQSSPTFFEKLVVDLLVAMGYGGGFKNAARVVGGSGDGGIDGIIKEDPLGLNSIYIQAKKRDGAAFIGESDIQKFVGALEKFQPCKGVFLTTGKFTEEAKEYVKGLGGKVVLIDGELLAKYMIDFNVGVSVRQAYEVKKIDTDYFAED